MKKMSFLAGLFLTAVFVLSAAFSQAQDSIQYQLVIRNAAGQLITNKQVSMKFSLIGGEQTFYQETMPATTDKFGNISVMVGTGKALKGAMKDVPWSSMEISLKVESDTDGGDNFKELGTVPIAAAPYAMFAATAGSNANGGSPKDGEALFEVCDRDGQPVFAVYNSGIVVYVDQNSADKAKRSGLVVTGRKATKEGETADYFAVDAEGTHIYIDDADDNTKAKRSGFVVTGRKATKGGAADSKPYADDRSATKADGAEVFAINGSLTTIYVDDTDDNAKAKRSGFVVTGRKSKAGDNIIDIDGSRTNLSTDALSIANAAADASTESTAPVAAMQITEASVEMSSDMAMEGGVRPSLDVDKNDEYNIYLSDNEEDDPAGFDEVYNYGSYNFYTYEVTGGGYDWIASFHDDRVVPLTSQYAYMMLNGDGEETALPQDAYVVVFYHWGDINVWPLRQLDNFKVSFALTDFNKPSDAIYGGNAENYVRLNVTISSKEAYRGCRVILGGQQVYTAKVETSQGTFNDVETGGSQEEFEVVFGETVTLAVTQVPDGQVFDSWRCDGRRYTDSVLHLPIIQMETEIYPVFKDKSPIVYVDGTYDDGDNSDGTKAKPFASIARALKAVSDSCAKDIVKRGYRIEVVENEDYENGYGYVTIESDENLNKAKYITISLNNNALAELTVETTAPVIVKNGKIKLIQAKSGDEDEPDALVNLSGTRLTLENCGVYFVGSDVTLHGAKVNSGELLLINTSISGFKQSGVYVASGATLTVNGDSENMVICENSAEQGGGIYVAGGGTLNIKGGWIANNSAKQGGGIYVADGATLNIKGGTFADNTVEQGGADIYLAGETATFNLYRSIESSIGGIGLADGAAVTAVGNYLVSGESHHGEPVEIWPIAYFDYIAKPENENQIVKLGADVQPYDLSIIRQYFGITNRKLIAEGYDLSLGADGKPYKYKTVYTTAQFRLHLPAGEDFVYTDVTYTYYRNSDNNEYLYLKYDWDDYNEYRNYWIVNGTIYGDTIYVKTKDTPAQPIQNFKSNITNVFKDTKYNKYTYSWNDAWENVYISETDDSYVNLLSCPQGSEYTNIFKNDDKCYIENPSVSGVDWAYLKNSVITQVGTINFFRNNLAVFKSLIEPSVSIAGRRYPTNNRNFVISDVHTVNWPNSGAVAYTLANNEASTEGILEKENGRSGFYIDGEAVLATTEKEVFEYKGELRKQTLAEIETMFGKLQDGFTVTIDATPGGTVQFGDFDPNPGQAKYKAVYGPNNVLTAIPDEGCVFTGWSDGVTSAERSVSVYSDINLTANFAKQYRVGYSYGDFASIEAAVDAIKTHGSSNSNYYYVILLNQQLSTPQSIVGDADNGYSLPGKGIKLTATVNGSISIASGTTGTALTINTTVPVTVENLTISGGNGANNGGGIYCSAGSNVTLDNGTKVTGNTAKSKGGGVYVDSNGKLTINNGAEVSNNNVVGTNSNGDEGGSAMYINHGEVLMNGGEISNNYSHETGDENDYNNFGLNSRGGIRLECAKFTLKDGKITRNKSGHLGGNIFSVESQIDICGGEISNGVIGYSGTSSDACGSALFLDINSVLNMSGGKIIGNKSLAGSSKTGSGAIVVRSSIFNMSGGTISGNTIESGGTKLGSAVRVEVTSQFNISDSAYIALDNDVSLEYYYDSKENQEKRATINIVGPLDSAMVANVTVQNCIDGVQVLTLADGDEAALAAACCKFNLRNSDAILSYDGTVKMINETTQKYEFPVNTANQYKYLFDLLNANTKIETDSVYISIENDLTINGFKPYDPGSISFKGIFEGNGHTLTIESINKNRFMVICWKNEGFIQNVKVNVANQSTVVCGKSGTQYPDGFSGICHENAGTIRNCWSDVSADVTFTGSVGSFCAYNYGRIENCLNTGNITGIFGANQWKDIYGVLGGISANNDGTVVNCVNYGTISMQTRYNSSDGLNGIPGAILGSIAATGKVYNSYWRQNCVGNSNGPNNMVYNDSRVRSSAATVTGCGYFTDYTNGSLTAGTTETCGGTENQNLQYGNDLFDALNGYVRAQGADTPLKGWKVEEDTRAAVLDFGN